MTDTEREEIREILRNFKDSLYDEEFRYEVHEQQTLEILITKIEEAEKRTLSEFGRFAELLEKSYKRKHLLLAGVTSGESSQEIIEQEVELGKLMLKLKSNLTNNN